MRIAILNHYQDEIINEIQKNHHLSLRVKNFKSSDNLINEIKKYDLIITDVYYDGSNIIDKIKNNILDKTYVIFVTDHEEMMKNCFGINIISFLLLSEIIHLSQLINFLDKKVSKEIMIKSNEEIKWLHLDKIIFIEYNLRDLYFYLNDGTIERKVNTNLNSILGDLNSDYIIINRTQIINLLYVLKIENSYVEMQNKKRLKLSVRRKKIICEKFMSMKGR